jgi:hypothetical protein
MDMLQSEAVNTTKASKYLAELIAFLRFLLKKSIPSLGALRRAPVTPRDPRYT